MKAMGMLLVAGLTAGCAATAPVEPYWRNASATRADFATDNQGCGARASRVKPTARQDQLTGGAYTPNNRIDRPPQPWVSSLAEGAYMECMRERGWEVARR